MNKTKSVKQSFDLTGKVAVISGGAGLLGEKYAEAIAEFSGIPILIDIDEKAGTNKASRISNEYQVDCEFMLCDITDESQILSVRNSLLSKFGHIDILINNAGLTRDNLAMRLKDEDWQTVLDVNLTSAFRLSRAVLRSMMKARWGRIIGITSIVGVTGNPGQANYAASKAGMIGMSKSLAQEVASRGVTVNCVAPGFIATAMTDVLVDEQKEKLNAGIPAGRMGAVDDIASACVYLASNEAAYVTGQTLHVNGGMTMI